MNVTFSKNEVDKRHFNSLRINVKTTISKTPSSRIWFAQLKAIILPILYVLLYLISTMFYNNSVVYYVIHGLMGITMVLIFINLVHNAVHDAIFKNRKMNRIILYFFDLMGGNSYIWKKRHKFLHHRFQNIIGWDSDIEQAGLFKIYPQENKTFIHHYQSILIFIFYPLFLLNLLLIRDFKDFFIKNRIVSKVCKIPPLEYLKLFLFKLFFVYYIFIIPISNGVSILNTLGAIFCMFVVGGTFALLVLLTPHVNSTNKFPVPDKKGKMTSSWFKHQFETTNDIALNNWVSRNIMGNFNFHLAHHLFPKLNSCYLPEVTKEIKKYSQLNNLDYREISLVNAFKSHFDLIKQNAKY